MNNLDHLITEHVNLNKNHVQWAIEAYLREHGLSCKI